MPTRTVITYTTRQLASGAWIVVEHTAKAKTAVRIFYPTQAEAEELANDLYDALTPWCALCDALGHTAANCRSPYWTTPSTHAEASKGPTHMPTTRCPVT
jgi:hypothetical protein